MKLDLNLYFESKLCPLTTLGMGRAGLVKKCLNTINMTLMESKDEQQFHAKRKQVRGMTSDQGTEKGINDGFVTVIPMFRNIQLPASSPDFYMYPKSLTMPDFLHILYNGLELRNPYCTNGLLTV